MLNYKKAAAVNVKKTDYRYWQDLALENWAKAEPKPSSKRSPKPGKPVSSKAYVNFYGAEGTTGKTV